MTRHGMDDTHTNDEPASPDIVEGDGERPNKSRKKDRSYQPGQPRHYCDVKDCDASFARLEHLRRHKTIRKLYRRGENICGM